MDQQASGCIDSDIYDIQIYLSVQALDVPECVEFIEDWMGWNYLKMSVDMTSLSSIEMRQLQTFTVSKLS